MITGGLVSIEDGNKKSEDYAPARKVRVELKFDVPAGADADEILDGVSITANREVHQLLGHTPSDRVAFVKPMRGATAEQAMVRESPEKSTFIEPDKPKRGRPPKAASPAADPTAMEDAPVEDLSDRAITATTVAVYSKLNKSAKVKELIRKFCPEDEVHPSLKRIPGDKRSEYLKVLNALTE
jgi:hypothetical protein